MLDTINKIKKRVREITLYRELPESMVILLTNPRSGSTWLLDSLRCHPRIYMLQSAVFFEFFNLDGRRYPIDLSKDNHANFSLEVQPGRWEKIPAFDFKDLSRLLPVDLPLQYYAIEKIHPHFFLYNVANFLETIEKIEKRMTVKIIYQVRDPKQSIYSFQRYQERNPTWNAHRKPVEISHHMRRIYEAILQMASIYPGLVIDYSVLINNFNKTIEQIFKYLWPGEREFEAELINRIFEKTAREYRVSSGTPFLDKKSPKSDLQVDAYLSSFHDEELDLCCRAYDTLLQLDS